ncbi:TetR family transcriptional regulator [Actinorhabdospora filicis]|nr:TetR family transcriptional regulator [Actinorhabdospora filicis]
MATRRDDRTQESRRLLIDAATRLFAEHGYRRTSFVDIAELAGISRGSIPWHFGNKLGLLEAVVDAQLDAVVGGFGGMDASLDGVMAFVRRPGARLFITLLAEAVEDDSPIRLHYARLHAALREAVRRAVPPLPGIPGEAYAALLVGAVIGLHAQWRVAPEAVDLDEVRETIRALLPG